MADESLKWALDFNLQGDGLRQANAGVGQLLQGLQQGQRAMVEFESGGQRMRVSLDNASRSLRDTTDRAETLRDKLGGITTTLGDVARGAKLVAEIIAAPFKALDALGDKSLEAFGERQATLRAYTTLLDDAAQAEVEFAKARQLAARTDLTGAQVVGAQKSLMVAGFRGRGLDQALAATMDAGAMAAPAERQMMVERFSRALSQILAKGKLQGEEIRQLSEAGLSRGRLNAELTKLGYGKDAASVEKSISGGKVSADAGIPAIERALLAQFGTKRPGDYATGNAGSISALVSNRDEAFSSLMQSFDQEAVPAATRYQEVLKAQSKAYDLSTSDGQRLTLTLQDLSNTSIALKSAWNEFLTGFLTSFSESYTAALQELGVGQDGLNDFGATAGKMGVLLGEMGGAAAHVVHWLDSASPGLEAFGILLQSAGTILGWAGSIIGTVVQAGRELVTILGLLGKTMADIAAGDFKEASRDLAKIKSTFLTGRADGGAVPLFNVVQDGLAQPQVPAGLKRPVAQTPSSGRGKGKGGGAGGGGGWSVSFDGGGGAVEVANYASDLATSLAGSPAVGGGEGARIEHVEIIIQGAGMSAEAIAEAVEDRLLRRLGRYQRTPSPGRS